MATQEARTDAAGGRRLFTRGQVGMRTSPESLWLIVNRRVYDVTSYAQRHPGGAAVLLQRAGQDCTEAFATAHRGSVLPRRLAKDFLIGIVDDEVDGIPVGDTASDGAESAEGSDMPGSDILSEPGDNVLAGDAALTAITDLLHQHLSEDGRLRHVYRDANVTDVAVSLRALLSCAFGVDGVEWPAIAIDPDFTHALSDELAPALVKTMRAARNPSPDAALETLRRSGAADGGGNLAKFFGLLREAADAQRLAAEVAEAAKLAEVEDEGFDGATESESGLMVDTATAAAALDEGIDVQNFGVLNLEPEAVKQVQRAWDKFMEAMGSRDAAGEAIYAVLVESEPQLHGMFRSPRALLATQLVAGFSELVAALGVPRDLQAVVEGLGCKHLNFEMSIPLIASVRDVIIGLLLAECAGHFTPAASQVLATVLNYAGGAFVYMRLNYSKRLSILASSWAVASTPKCYATPHGDTGVEPDGDAYEWLKIGDGALKGGAASVPDKFDDMFRFNVAVMHLRGSEWMDEVLASMGTIVAHAANFARLEEECELAALRIARTGVVEVDFSAFKSVILASLRSLVPKAWDHDHEDAWNWLWEKVRDLLKEALAKPHVYEPSLAAFISSLDDATTLRIRADIYRRFFDVAPRGEDHFKQSTARLHFIADRVLIMSLDIYREPKRLAEDISSLGLRHVGYGIPTDLFAPFTSSCIEVVREVSGDPHVAESFAWSLSLVSRMLVRTITEGSTMVMQAINVNSAPLLRKAVGFAPRAQRASWMLTVQVGTQSISPLACALERGNTEAARAILEDLFTIRSDRDRYYFGSEELFSRHPDIVKLLLNEAPALLPTVLDGLIWRSRVVEDGHRRVNYFVRPLLVGADGGIGKTLRWLARSGSPIFARHPSVVMVADLVWNGVVRRIFLLRKAWLTTMLVVFVCGQAVKADGARTAVGVCRLVAYSLGLGQLLVHHAHRSWSCAKEGSIIRPFGIFPIPAYLHDEWQERCGAVLAILLVLMLLIDPVIRCLAAANGELPLFTQKCEAAAGLSYGYSLVSALAIAMYFVLLLDLAALSTRVSAYALVCFNAVPEVILTLVAILYLILMNSCAVSALDHDNPDFEGIPAAALSFCRIALGMFTTRFDFLSEDFVLLIVVLAFVCLSVIFALNLLVAQLSLSYAKMFQEMVGFARLNRVELIANLLPHISLKRQRGLVETLRFDERIEFGIGDVGLAGGLQVLEPSNVSVVTSDRIRRFGGSTSPDAPWPHESLPGDAGTGDTFTRLETKLVKVAKRLSRGAGGRSRHASSAGGGSSVGSGSVWDASGGG